MFGDNSLVLGDFQVVIKKDNNDNNGDNSPATSNPATPSPQSITNSNEKSDNSAKVNPEKDSLSEEKNSKEDNTAKSTENSPIKTDNQTPISQYLRDIKQVTLTADGNLIIEFNSSASNHLIGQVITSEQISTNQELQAIKNYCQQNGKNSLSQQELNSLINANKTDSALTNKSKDDNNNALAIGLVAAFALIVGLVIGLVVKRKKRN